VPNSGIDGFSAIKAVIGFFAVRTENRPIDADSPRNRANRGSSKFSFEFKSANF